jgi:hypothetical protein
LSKFEDDLLLSFGLPAILLPAVRAVRTPDELLAVNKHLASKVFPEKTDRILFTLSFPLYSRGGH